MKSNNSLDELIQQSKTKLSTVKAPNHIWNNIVNEISEDSTVNKANILYRILSLFDISHNTRKIFVFTATTILGLLIIKSILNPQLITVERTGALAIKLDKNLINEFQKYEKVIDNYKIDYLDQDVISNDRDIFPYIERLVSLDNTITRCYSALEINPYSQTVNKSLVTAYQKKISALEKLDFLIRRTS